MAQCEPGTGAGVDHAAANNTDGSTLLAIYHVSSAQEAKEALQTFVGQVQQLRANLLGGALKQLFDVTLTPAAETMVGTPIDVLNLTVTPPAQPAKPDAPATPLPLTVAGRVAYLDNKMLLAFGPDSKAQMAAIFSSALSTKSPGSPHPHSFNR